MSTIDLYEVLKRIPNVSSDEAKSVADTLAHTDDVATKTDLTELEMHLTWRMIIIAGVIIAAVGLMFTAAGFFPG